jgi:pimeloyl-ACP methyl ester carboxylesterase
MPQLDVNGLSFHVQTLTQPPPAGAPPRPKVVMVHGLVIGHLGSYYLTIAGPVAQVADTYLYDLRGHGRSEMPASGYAIGDHVDDLRALLDTWEIDEPVHLVSNSFGGVVALAFARRFPERVASLVLIEAQFATEGWGEEMASSLAVAAFGLEEDEVRDWLEQHGTRRLNRLARRSERLIFETTMIDDLRGERPFPREALAEISCPTLAMYGQGSEVLDNGRALERLVPGCELHIVPGSTHELLAEAVPYVRDQTVAWLTRNLTGQLTEHGAALAAEG